jgi:L,D-peptidoglycan transpeptidase YkuD (ErfK/YbiS/YcfS/YnhG family)
MARRFSFSFIMKTFLYSLLAITIFLQGMKVIAKELPVLLGSTQMVVVTTSDWNSPSGTLQRYERQRPGKRWHAVGEAIPVMVGKTGLAWGRGLLDNVVLDGTDPIKKEGDGKAPAGVFRLSKAFGYAPQEQPGWKMPYVALTPSIECVDDPGSKFYNTLVDTASISPDWGSHENEKMRRSDDLYRWGIVVDHNSKAFPGGGSCIFMHIWQGPGQPTVGCTAMAQENLEALLSWLDPDRKPVLVQMPVEQYRKAPRNWHLPHLNTAKMQAGAGSSGK